jgi:hypothetical protein
MISCEDKFLKQFLWFFLALHQYLNNISYFNNLSDLRSVKYKIMYFFVKTCVLVSYVMDKLQLFTVKIMKPNNICFATTCFCPLSKYFDILVEHFFVVENISCYVNLSSHKTGWTYLIITGCACVYTSLSCDKGKFCV